jgi:hypothetical protein
MPTAVNPLAFLKTTKIPLEDTSLHFVDSDAKGGINFLKLMAQESITVLYAQQSLNWSLSNISGVL